MRGLCGGAVNGAADARHVVAGRVGEAAGELDNRGGGERGNRETEAARVGEDFGARDGERVAR